MCVTIINKSTEILINQNQLFSYSNFDRQIQTEKPLINRQLVYLLLFIKSFLEPKKYK